jgi:hypothetical protein
MGSARRSRILLGIVPAMLAGAALAEALPPPQNLVVVVTTVEPPLCFSMVKEIDTGQGPPRCGYHPVTCPLQKSIDDRAPIDCIIRAYGRLPH